LAIIGECQANNLPFDKNYHYRYLNHSHDPPKANPCLAKVRATSITIFNTFLVLLLLYSGFEGFCHEEYSRDFFYPKNDSNQTMLLDAIVR